MSFRFREESGLVMVSVHTTTQSLLRDAVSRQLLWLILLLTAAVPRLWAGEFVEGFDSERPSWKSIVRNGSGVRIREQRRNLYTRRGGVASEQIVVESASAGAMLRLEHSLPRSVPIDDLLLSIEFRANRPGAILAMRMVFPQQQDPRTGEVLTAWLRGDIYTSAGEWQSLRARADRTALRERITRLRAELQGQSLNLDKMYLDRAVVLIGLQRGTTELFIDELRWSGYAAPQGKIRTVGAEVPDTDVRLKSQMRLDRLLVNEHPVVLRFAPHHDEKPETLAELGVNAVWIRNHLDSAQIAQLRDAGIWSLATPPRGRVSDEADNGTVVDDLPTAFGARSDGILAWYMGTRIPPSAQEALASQVRLVRAADRTVNRPILGDIGGLERSYSRLLDGVGLTRHPLQTMFSLHDYRQFLGQKRRLLRPGTFVTTWIQTEPEPQGGSLPDPLPTIEPELIRLLAWSGLSAGARGIGYWKRTSFKDDFPGARERDLAIAITNQEIDLLEPWLATWTVLEHQRVSVQSATSDASARSSASIKAESLRELREMARRRRMVADSKAASASDASKVVEMAIMSSPNGQLMIPLLYESDSQFVPGQMALRSLDIVIPGVPDTATIWKVTTTDVSTVPTRRRSTGARITLENFDQLAALVISTDPNWGNILRGRIAQIRDRSARMWYDLASEKYQRVIRVDAELQAQGFGIPDGPQLLDRASAHLDSARKRMAGSGNPSNAAGGFGSTGSHASFVRMHAQAALQALRILQRSHWDNAVNERGSAVASPYTTSFQTLPEHWRFVKRIGSSRFADYRNLLPSGNFESTDTTQMIASGWKNMQPEIEGVRAAAELASLGRESGYALRLLAVPATNSSIPVALERVPIALESPPIPVHAGQIVHVSGRVRIQSRVAATIEGVTVTESLTGSRLRWKQTSGWETFELIREAREDGELRLRLTMHGLGDALFDDLKVVASEPQSSLIQQTSGELPSGR